MYTNVNLLAPLGILAFLGTSFFIALLALLFLYSLLRGKRSFGKAVTFAAAILGTCYMAIGLAFSFASTEKTLARGQEKHFCEIDCHLAYSIVNVNRVDSYDTTRYAVTIKTRFDEETISRTRGNGLLYPNPRLIAVVDDQGNKYLPSGQSYTALTTPLRPGQSYLTVVAFDLNTDVHDPTLLINEADRITQFIIGHENSPLHKQTRFQL
jgi:hypothetical protein